MAKPIDKDIAMVIDELESHGYTIGRLLHSKLMEISNRLQDDTSPNGAQDPTHELAELNKAIRSLSK